MNLADPREQITTVEGETTLGALCISILNIGDEDATVNGVPLPPGKVVNYEFVGKPYRAITYNPNNSTLQILTTL